MTLPLIGMKGPDSDAQGCGEVLTLTVVSEQGPVFEAVTVARSSLLRV